MKDYPRQERSIGTFEQAKTYELVGSTFRLVMDAGTDYSITFEDKTTFAWSPEGGETSRASYSCLKADETTYFVGVHPGPEEHHIYVLDFEQRLVTRVVWSRGNNPKFPYLFNPVYDFGAIDMEGYRLPFKRHCFTSEMIGTTVRWRWSPMLYTKHAYLESNYYRITWDDDGEAAEDFDTTNEMLPTTDEHGWYVKIKEDMYLFTVSEEHEERALGDLQYFRGDVLSFLQNYKRMYQVGCGFGTNGTDGKLNAMYVGVSAYGKPVSLPDRFLNEKNPFTV